MRSSRARPDGNPDTVSDPEWLPQSGRTAADPSYPGAHGAISAAAAEVLNLFFHNDNASFTVTSESLAGAKRSFSTFSGAAKEASLSRIYAGQHFRFDQAAGDRLGQAIAQYVFEHILRPGPSGGVFVQHNLISNLPGIADSVDPNLANPWGIAFSSESPFWLASNHSGLSTVCTGDGGELFSVRIPGAPEGNPGGPTGVVFNSTTNLIEISNQPVRFIFSGEDGVLSTWSTGTDAILVADQSAEGAIYKGLALAAVGDSAYLYAPDFHNGRIDVFDAQFRSSIAPLPAIPAVK